MFRVASEFDSKMQMCSGVGVNPTRSLVSQREPHVASPAVSCSPGTSEALAGECAWATRHVKGSASRQSHTGNGVTLSSPPRGQDRWRDEPSESLSPPR